MKVNDFLINKLYNHQKKLEGLALFLLFSLISFRFENLSAVWVWNEKLYIPIILVLIIVLTSIVWIRIERMKTNSIIENIKLNQNKNNIENQTNELTYRQKQIFDLIQQGHSNKEIMEVLCIELSTLKTHINNIYRILNINNRKEAFNYQKNKD